MEEINKMVVKEARITDQQRKLIYILANRISKDTIDELCPALFRTVLNSEKGPLKGDLGAVIFHLQKNECLNSRIGLEKLLDASLMVAPQEMFKILESSGQEANNLAKKIKEIL